LTVDGIAIPRLYGWGNCERYYHQVFPNVSCSFTVNGTTHKGHSAEECATLRTQLGFHPSGHLITKPPTQPLTPSPTPAPVVSTSSPTTSSSVAPSALCSFDVNGQLFTGNSQTECDELKAASIGKSANRKSGDQSSSTTTSMPAWGWALIAIGAVLGLALIIGAAILLQRSNVAHRSETV
jgi:hypothetical protein